MEKGQHGHDLGRRVEQPVTPLVDLAHIGGDIGMGEQGALGDAGGATGILLHRNVIGGDDHRVGRGFGRDHVAEAGDAIGKAGFFRLRQILALGHREQDFLDQRQGIGEVADHQRLDVTGCEQGFALLENLLQVQRDHHIGAGIGRDVAELGHGIERVAIDHRSAGPQHAEIGNGIEGRVGQHDGDARALGDAELALQGAGKGDDLLGEIAECGGAAEEIQRNGGWILGAGGKHLFMYRCGVDLGVPAHALGIARYPGARRSGGRRRGIHGVPPHMPLSPADGSLAQCPDVDRLPLLRLALRG